MVPSKTPSKAHVHASHEDSTPAVEIKRPAVTIETKKITTDDCCKTDACTPSTCCVSKKICCGGKILFGALTLVNTVLLSFILCNQNDAEIKKVGGKDNFRLVQDLQKTEGYKNRQRQQIQQAMQMVEQRQQAAPTQQAPEQQAPSQTNEIQQAPATQEKTN